MNNNDITIERQKSDVLQKMVQIPRIIRGKLTSQSFEKKGRIQGPYYTLQRWDEGKNKSQRVSPEELPVIQEAVSGYELFGQLADEYVGLCEKQTWEAQSAEFKKKFRVFSRHPLPKPSPSSRKRVRK